MVLLMLLGLIKISENAHPVSFFGLVNYQYSVGMVSLLVSGALRASNIIDLRIYFAMFICGKNRYL